MTTRPSRHKFEQGAVPAECRICGRREQGHEIAGTSVPRTRGIAPEQENSMSTKQALKDAGVDKFDSMGKEELAAHASKLDVPGRSKMGVDELRKAVRKVGAAKAAKSTTAPGSGKRLAGPARERELYEEYGELKVGKAAKVVRNVDLSERTSGFAGLVEKDATGKIVEIAAHGKGVQVTIDLGGKVGAVTFGARHLASA